MFDLLDTIEKQPWTGPLEDNSFVLMFYFQILLENKLAHS